MSAPIPTDGRRHARIPDLPTSRHGRRAGLRAHGGGLVPPPSDLVGASPSVVAGWFDDAVDGQIPEADGTLETARRAAEAVACHAKADNTRTAYRAGVRAWCALCPLPTRPADIAYLHRGRPPVPHDGCHGV